MKRKERGRLLRERFRAVGKLPYRAITRPPKLKMAHRLPPKVGRKPQGPFFGVSLYERHPKWVEQANVLSNHPFPTRRRREGELPLVKIAKQLPRKLIRVVIPPSRQLALLQADA